MTLQLKSLAHLDKEEVMSLVLPDYLDVNLKVLFIGYNPSLKSDRVGHHYANPSNRFWKILDQSGLLPRQLLPDEDGDLLKYGYGLTNIVDKPTRTASDITKNDYKQGRLVLVDKLKKYKPKIACYVGKGVYEHMTKTRPIPWGEQKVSLLPPTIDYVVPSSSGLVRIPIADIIEIYRGLLPLIGVTNQE